MSELVTVRLSSIDPNPMRRLKEYPFNASKLEALQRSIKDVGLWEGIIGRRAGNRVQIAFGHHRKEAAERELGKNASVPVIVRDLSDQQMLQFMGRENLEDYNADFLVMLETWEAAVEFTRRPGAEKIQELDLSILLGWTRHADGPGVRMNETSQACANSAKLISGGYIKRDQLAGLSVKAVREICGRVVAQHEALERMAKQTGRPAQEIESAKRASGKAGARVAKDVRGGRVAQKDIRGSVDVEAYRHAREAKKQTPLFGMFGKSLAESISRVAKGDALGEKLTEIKRALGNITTDEDLQIVKRIAFECDGAAERFTKWHTTFASPKTKVVSLREIK